MWWRTIFHMDTLLKNIIIVVFNNWMFWLLGIVYSLEEYCMRFLRKIVLSQNIRKLPLPQPILNEILQNVSWSTYRLLNFSHYITHKKKIKKTLSKTWKYSKQVQFGKGCVLDWRVLDTGTITIYLWLKIHWCLTCKVYAYSSMWWLKKIFYQV